MQTRAISFAAFLTVVVGGLSVAQQSANLGDDGPRRRGPDETAIIPPPPPVTHPFDVAELSDGEYALTLGQVRFDPVDGLPPIDGPWAQGMADDLGNDLRLVQFTGPTNQQWIDDLTARGMEIVQYIHPYTYIVWGKPFSARNAQLPADVRFEGDFVPAFRVLPWYRNLPDRPVDMRAMVYRGAQVESIIEQIAMLGADVTSRAKVDRVFEIVSFTVNGQAVADIAQIAGVYSIKAVPTDGGLRGEMSNQINAGNYDGSNTASPGYESWLATIGLDGNGVIIANVDSGVDESHPDLTNRMLPCSGTTCDNTSSSHGTHTAGIMAADGASGVTDSFGFLRGLGVAPGADLVAQNYSPHFSQAGGMLLLMTDSYNNGASLSGNSWGPAGSPQGYDDDTRQVDVGVRDADPDAPGNQPLTFVLSFMNGGGGTSTQGSPDEGKNLFNIGSTKMQTGSGEQILDINDLSSNSGHGPALDGRTIPHMVAPGCNVDSTTPGGNYDLLCGTSMASPHVSGAVALFIEHYRNLTASRGLVEDPSPALIKAAFLPACHNLEGFDDADGNTLGHPFDNKQGWGRMNLPAVLDANPLGVQYVDNPVVFDDTGDEWTMSFSPLESDQPIRIMLVWTDAPGHGLGGSTPAWNNDLDLEVVADGITYRGNNFAADGWSQSGGTADGVNNTEGVFLGPNAPGSVTVTVRAANISSDGIPGEGDLTDQDFALVAYNAAVEPGFFLASEANTHEGCAPGLHQFSLDIGQILDFSETVSLSASTASSDLLVGTTDSSVTPPATVGVSVRYLSLASAGDHVITVTATSGDTVKTFDFFATIRSEVPDTPLPTTPANNATAVGLAPTLSWSSAAGATSYEVQVATDPDFNNIAFSATTTEPTVAVEPALDTLTSYYWRVRALNPCGLSDDSSVFLFTTLDRPPLLIIDDDDNSPDVSATYIALLDSLGYEFDVWDTGNSDGEPDATTLSEYDFVIWFTGDEWGGAAGPGAAGETALAAYLDDGGCLFLSSQDYHFDRGLTSFMTEYLGVGSITNDTDQNTLTGADVFDGLGPYSTSYPFTDYSDTLVVAESSELAFIGDVGNAGVSTDGGTYRSTFLVFPLEAISGASNQEQVLGTFIEWCDDMFTTCPGDTDGDNSVGLSDLLNILSKWGLADADADLDDSGTVGLGDLLEVLGQWGSSC